MTQSYLIVMLILSVLYNLMPVDEVNDERLQLCHYKFNCIASAPTLKIHLSLVLCAVSVPKAGHAIVVYFSACFLSEIINHYDVNPHRCVLFQGIATFVLFQDRFFIQMAEIQKSETGTRNCYCKKKKKKKDVSFDFITLV